MGISSSKSTQKVDQTVTPTNPPWATEAVQDQVGHVSNFMDLDPQSLVAGPSALQQQAFGSVDNLGGWQAGNQTAQDMAGSVGAAGPNLMDRVTLGGPATFGGAQLAPASQYDGVKVGNSTAAGQTNIAPTANADAQSALTNLSAYMSPYTNDVVDSALRNYDYQTGVSRAAMEAGAARNRAFGGSRYGVQAGTFDALSDMNRAGTEASLRDNAFRFGAGLSGADADRRQAISMFNANSANTRGLTQAQLDQQRLIRNAEAADQFKLAQAGYNAQQGMFNADAANQFALTQGGMDQQAGLFNAGNQNQFALAQGNLDAQTGMFNANQMDEATAQQLQAAGLLGSLSSDAGAQARADLGLTADLGTIQQQIEQAQAQAPATQLLTGSQALGMTPLNLFSGQNVNGTTVTKSNPSLFNQLLAAGSVASKFI
jgi:hypothetical protein